MRKKSNSQRREANKRENPRPKSQEKAKKKVEPRKKQAPISESPSKNKKIAPPKNHKNERDQKKKGKSNLQPKQGEQSKKSQAEEAKSGQNFQKNQKSQDTQKSKQEKIKNQEDKSKKTSEKPQNDQKQLKKVDQQKSENVQKPDEKKQTKRLTGYIPNESQDVKKEMIKQENQKKENSHENDYVFQNSDSQKEKMERLSVEILKKVMMEFKHGEKTTKEKLKTLAIGSEDKLTDLEFEEIYERLLKQGYLKKTQEIDDESHPRIKIEYDKYLSEQDMDLKKKVIEKWKSEVISELIVLIQDNMTGNFSTVQILTDFLKANFPDDLKKMIKEYEWEVFLEILDEKEVIKIYRESEDLDLQVRNPDDIDNFE